MSILIWELIILIYSVILHEIAHGVSALYFGDDTAKKSNRLTLNPLPHIDPIMTILVPFLLIMSGSPIIFGGARPVPINPQKFNNYKAGIALTAAAGPLTNIIIALVAAFIFQIAEVDFSLYQIITYTVLINIFLAVFNLIPIPPLDGSKIIAGILPNNLSRHWLSLERYGIIFVIVFLFAFAPFINRLVYPAANFLIALLLSKS